MSKQIKIQFINKLSETKIQIICECLGSIVARIDPGWKPQIKIGTSPDLSYQIDRGNNWWAHFDNDILTINSRYADDKLMDAVETVLMYRLPPNWDKELIID